MNISANAAKKVLLFTSEIRSPGISLPIIPHCGIAYIAEALRRKGISYRFTDLRFKKARNNFFQLIDRVKPDFLGTTMFSVGYRHSYKLFEEVKSRFPSLKIIVGGPHASVYKENMLEECRAIDYGVTHDGDDAIVELCAGNDREAVKGLLYRQDGCVKYSGDRAFITDLDRLGFPLYEGFPLRSYAFASMPISTSRGCFGECTFCAVSSVHGRKMRFRSAASVAEEIAYWYKKGYRFISAVDDNFAGNRQRTLELCDILRAKKLRRLQIKIESGIRADCLDEEVAQSLFAAGVNKICIGVESANDHVLQNIKKRESVAQLEQAIQLVLKAGIQVSLFFIIGLPGETEKDLRNSFDFARRMGVGSFGFFRLTPYPGTELFEWAKAKGYLLYPPEEYLNFMHDPDKATLSVIETPELSKELREKYYIESGKICSDTTYEVKIELLARKVGRPLARVLIFIYESAWFKKMFLGSFFLKKYVTLIRTWLCI